MDIAVLSDIHGNYAALERCMAFALKRGIGKFLFLGDYIGELAYPQKTMKMLYEIREKYDCTFVRGNKEDYWIGRRSKGGCEWRDNDSTTGMLLYAYSHLTDADIDWFEAMPTARNIYIEGCEPFTICHGSPDRTNEDMIPDTDRIREIMDQSAAKLIVCGHTHRQGRYEYNGKTVLNPGSLGMPLGSGGRSQFLILHSNETDWEGEFVSLDYDTDVIISDMKAEALDRKAPYWNYVAERVLRDGKISNGTVLAKAMELCRMETGECAWPRIPEKYWEQAVKVLYHADAENE